MLKHILTIPPKKVDKQIWIAIQIKIVQLHQQVLEVKNQFSSLELYLNEPIYQNLELPPETQIQVFQSTIEPLVQHFVKYYNEAIDVEKYEQALCMRLIPKSVALAGSLLSDIPLPSNKQYIVGEIAMITYAYNTLIDTLEPSAAQNLLLELKKTQIQSLYDKDTSGFLRIICKITKDERAFETLKDVVINRSMIQPSRFDLQLISVSDIDRARIKLSASGFEICTWIAALTLDSENYFDDSNRDIYAIMTSHEYRQLNTLGAIITRIADDLGDQEEDANSQIFNMFNSSEQKIDIIRNFCQLAQVDYEQIDTTTDMTVLMSFINVFRDKSLMLLVQPNLVASEKLLIKVFIRSVIIVSVNLIGDSNLSADMEG